MSNLVRGVAASIVAAFVVAFAAPARAQELLASGYNSDEVHRFDYATGTYLGALGTFNGAHAATHGPDGLLYVCAEEDDKVERYDPVTLAFVDVFIWDDPAIPGDPTGGLDGPTTAVFGPDGNLYVASFNTDEVLRYDGATGAFLNVFVTANSGGLNGPDAGTTFGPDGHLYVLSYWNDKVIRYDGTTGASLGDFVSAGTGGLTNPRTLRFRSDGVLYVSSEGSNGILRFDRTGALIDKFIAVAAPTGFVISPYDGNVYVESISKQTVVVFDGLTAARLTTLVKPGGGGLDGPVALTFRLDPDLRTSRITPGVAGVANDLTISNGTPSGVHFLIVGTLGGSLRVGGSPAAWLGIADPLLFPVTADAAGLFTTTTTIDPALAGVSLLVQSFDPATHRMSNLVEQTLQ